MKEAVKVSNDSPVLLDRYPRRRHRGRRRLPCATASDVLIGGIMEHVEQAGVHSGDSACCLPPHSLASHVEREHAPPDRRRWRARSRSVGLMNVQYAIQRDTVYVLEVNPRASRTVPYVSKATGLPLAKIARALHGGQDRSKEQGVEEVDADLLLGEGGGVPVRQVPGRRHHPRPGDEVDRRGDGRGRDLRRGVRQVADRRRRASCRSGGSAFISVRDGDKVAAVQIARDLVELGFTLLATRGTAAVLKSHGIPVTAGQQGGRGPTAHRRHDQERRRQLHRQHRRRRRAPRCPDSRAIRTTALAKRVTYYTTVAGGKAACAGDEAPRRKLEPYVLQELHAKLRAFLRTPPPVTLTP